MKVIYVLTTIAVVLFIRSHFQRANTPITYLSMGKMVVTGRLHLPDSKNNREAFDRFFCGCGSVAMDSSQVQQRARKYLESTRPELVAQNPKIINYSVIHRNDKSFWDLYVESDNPLYAQLYLQACMDEYLKVRSEVQESTTETTLIAIAADISRFEIEIKNKEGEIDNFLTANKNVLDKSLQAEHELLKSNLERYRERHKLSLRNYDIIQNSQTLNKNQELVAIGQEATVAMKREPLFIDSRF